MCLDLFPCRCAEIPLVVLCRELLSVCCAASYFQLAVTMATATPRATPDLLCRCPIATPGLLCSDYLHPTPSPGRLCLLLRSAVPIVQEDLCSQSCACVSEHLCTEIVH